MNKTLKTVRANLILQKKLFIIHSILSAVGLGMTVLGILADISPFIGIGCLLFAIAYFMSVLAVKNTFCDMSDSRLCDMIQSLPMSAKQRYVTKLLTLLLGYILPFCFSTLICLIVAILESSIGDDDTARITACLFLPFVLELFAVSVAILSNTCCGRSAECVYFSVILAGLFSAAPKLFFKNNIARPSGITRGLKLPSIFTCWGVPNVFDDLSNFDLVMNIVVNMLISCLVIFLCWFLYKKRDAKTVGHAIAFDLFKYIVLFMCTAVIFEWGAMGSAMAAILVAAIFYTIISIVISRKNRSMRGFIFSLGFFAATIAFLFAFKYAGYVSEGFGVGRNSFIFTDTSNIGGRISVTLYSKNGDYYNESTPYYYYSHLQDENAQQNELNKKMKTLCEYLDKNHIPSDISFFDYLNGDDYGRYNVSVSADWRYNRTLTFPADKMSQLASFLEEQGFSEKESDSLLTFP